MSNYYAPCFYRIDVVVIPSYIELPWRKEMIVVAWKDNGVVIMASVLVQKGKESKEKERSSMEVLTVKIKT